MAPPNVENMITLKVDNVPFNCGNEELREIFTQFGEIGDVYIPRARGTNESRGFAFVRFMQQRDAEEAIEAMEGKDFQGRDLRVQFAKQRRPDNPREFYQARDDDRGFDDRGGRGFDDDRRGGGGRFDDRRGGRYDDDRRGGGDRYDDDRRGGGDRYGERSRRHSRSRSPRRDHREHRGRDRSRSRSPPRHRSRSPPRGRD